MTQESTLPYSQFRTGLTYADVRAMLWEESCAQRQAGKPFLTVRRQAVLGRWFQIKQDMYSHYVACNGSVEV